ncbi:hypothetical protein PAL_GLEAN10008795 [Pteropus alecto]|uniref:Uncharacterized protein n=1 Tax=Pteropus alecto TaxID=9402 RepID=L5KSR9_PTEAL|nr:hypothetical protein PAL_GLEAN10008795 [Pteropus alecto]
MACKSLLQIRQGARQPLLRPLCSLSGLGSRRRPKAVVLRLEKTTHQDDCISVPRGHTALARSFPLGAIQGGRRRGSLTIALSPAAELDIRKAWPRQGKWDREIQKAEGK